MSAGKYPCRGSAVNRHTGLSESISYSFKNEHSNLEESSFVPEYEITATVLMQTNVIKTERPTFDLNQISGEIKTARALDRETADFHQFTVVASLHFLNGSYNSHAEVLVTVEDINDNPPVLAKEEYTISLSLHAKPGLLLNLNASDKDIGENAEVAFEITDGNKKQLFWINSSSGDLFLVAPITFTAGDVVVLVVEARDASTTNALRDTTIEMLKEARHLRRKRRKKRYLRGTSDHLQMEDVKRTCSGMNSAVVTSCTPRSPMELSGTFSSESQSPTISTKLRKMDSQVRLVEGCQVVVELCHMEPKLLSSLQPTEQVSEIEPRAFISTPVGVDLCHMDPDPSLRFSDVYSPIGSATDVTFNRCNDLDTSLSDTWGKSVSSLTPRSLRNLWLGYESEPSAVSIRKLANEPLSSHSEDPQVSMDHSYREHDSSSTVNWPPQFYEMEPSSPLSTPASGFSDPDSLFGSVTDVTLNYGNASDTSLDETDEPSPTLSPPASRISDLDSPVGSVTDVKLNYSNASDTSLDETEFKSVSSFTPGSLKNLWRGLSCENEPSAVPTRDITKETPPSSVKVARISRDQCYMQADSPSNVQCSTKMFEMEASSPSAPASRFGDAELPVVKVIDPTSKYSNDLDKTSSETEIESVSSLTPESLRNLWRGLSYENKPQATSIRDSTRESSSSLFKVSQVEYPTSPSTVTSNVADLLSDSLSDVAINYPPSSRNVSLNSMSSVSVFLGNLSTRSRISNRTEIGEHSSRSTGASELTLLQRVLSALRAPFRPYETAESTINVQSNDRRAPSQSSHPDGTL
ncbi:hypothetical protein pdam_00017732 [Pocillopora damicornis]|uniref:Cadherin domain-containing protein n=1 Tax=Pocillopora damicornis TaxID=46731 RepID=A0A3M6UDK0_POCDA|nr:hypothetical protein pdam_00017732 [Pocillopora damicornis]